MDQISPYFGVFLISDPDDDTLNTPGQQQAAALHPYVHSPLDNIRYNRGYLMALSIQSTSLSTSTEILAPVARKNALSADSEWASICIDRLG